MNEIFPSFRYHNDSDVVMLLTLLRKLLNAIRKTVTNPYQLFRERVRHPLTHIMCPEIAIEC